MKFSVLLHSGSGKAKGHDEEKESHHLQPQLVGGAPERSRGGADRAHDRAERTVAYGLLPGHLPGNSGRHPELSKSRNLVHGLDFNSLRRYNDAALGSGVPENRSAADGI
jgi:hypothetical protein